MGLIPRRGGPGATPQFEEALESLRRKLPLEECTVELRSFANGVASIRIAGGCRQCAMDARALVPGIEAHLKASVPGVKEVRVETE